MAVRTSGQARSVTVRSGAEQAVWKNVDVEIDLATGIVQLSLEGELSATAHISAVLIRWT